MPRMGITNADTTGISGTTETTDAPRTRWTTTRVDLQQRRLHQRTVEVAWSWTRLISFVGFLVIYLSAPGMSALVVAGMIACVVVFILALRRHAAARHRRILTDRQILVISESLQRLGGTLVALRSNDRPAQAPAESTLPPAIDDGDTWPLTDQERDDLDLYAPPLGLFGLLNRTSTRLGGRRLDAMLNHPCLDPQTLDARQTAVRWLHDHDDERFFLMAAAVGQRGHDAPLDALVAAIREAEPLNIRTRVLRIWGFASGVLIIFGVIQAIVGGPGAGLNVLVLLNMLVLWRTHRQVSAFNRTWSDMGPIVGAWLAVLRPAYAHLPDKGNLGRLREQCGRVLPDDAAPRLHRHLQWLNVGGLIQVLLNLLFLYDFQIAAAVLPRVARHRTALLDALAATTELEALCSLACYAAEQPVCTFPSINNDNHIEIEAGTHPLIAPDQVVANDLRVDRSTRVWLITGSNMSGKSTFLRMVGINMLLAQVGTAVTARRMQACIVRLLTDLRARDNLARNESYYLAEVRQLRRMVLPPDGEAPVLGLIDEPFRGTNSEEQAAASLAVVRSLLESRHFFIVATHERRLTDLAVASESAANHHFRESLEGHEMVFDYHLRTGPAHTRNAIRILQREGYPTDLVRHATELITHPD